jgi:hypothetical protein
MLYTDLNEALDRAVERSAAKASDRPYLQELLSMSYGTSPDGQIVYRPFYVAARFLQQSRRDQTVKEGDGVKFTGQAIPIASLLDLQSSLDQALAVQAGFETALLSLEPPSLKQLEAARDGAVLFLRRYQPRGVL